MRRVAKKPAFVILVALVGVALAPAPAAGQGSGGNSAVIPPQRTYQCLS
jgi:hypothetical protein